MKKTMNCGDCDTLSWWMHPCGYAFVAALGLSALLICLQSNCHTVAVKIGEYGGVAIMGGAAIGGVWDYCYHCWHSDVGTCDGNKDSPAPGRFSLYLGASDVDANYSGPLGSYTR